MFTFSFRQRPATAEGRFGARFRGGRLRAALFVLSLTPTLAFSGSLTAVHADTTSITALGAAVRATAGTPYTSTVAAFVDSDGNNNAALYTASVNWGDGSATDSNAQLVATGQGNFVVTDAHTYATAGTYTVTVQIVDGDGATAVATGTATVAPSGPTGSSGSQPSGSGGSLPCAQGGYGSLSLVAQAYDSTVLGDSPLGFWTLANGCSVASDSSGNGLTGIETGDLADASSSSPISGQTSFGFDGTSAAVLLGDPAALQPQQLSVEAWIQTTSTPQSTNIIVRKRYYGYALYLGQDGTPHFDINDQNAVPYVASGTTSVADGRWHQLVGTYDGSKIRLYVDGTLVDTENAAPIFYQQDAVAIGRDGGWSGSFFTGNIADVAIYGHALSNSRISLHFHTVEAPAPAVARPQAEQQ